MTVTAVDYSGTYDGNTHSGGATASVTAGTTYQYSTDGGQTWSSTVPSITNVGTVVYTVKASNPNYEDATDTGTLTLAKRHVIVTITGAEETVTYNGKEQRLAGHTFAASDPLYLESYLTQSVADKVDGTNAGQYPMNLQGGFGNSNPNFEVEFSITDGLLIIEQKKLTITVLPQTYTYNGRAQGENGGTYTGRDLAEKVSTNGLINDRPVVHELYSITLNGNETNAGVYNNKIKATLAVIHDQNGTDVTANYAITYEAGRLTIDKYPLAISIKGENDTKPYDGTEHAVKGYTAECSDNFFVASKVT